MKHLRRKLLVDRAFQGRLLLRLCCYWAIYHLALWHLLFLFTVGGALLSHDPTAPMKTWGTQYRDFFASHVSIIVCFLVMLPILGRDLLKFSHRFVGPFVRFRNTLQIMLDGQVVQPIRLRKHDLPSEFLPVFNEFIVKWNERLGHKTELPAETDVEADEPDSLELVESR